MVDHSHLSAGNSASSPSHDPFADLGVSAPSSPSVGLPGSLSSSPRLAESNPDPPAILFSSSDSDASNDIAVASDALLFSAPSAVPEMQDVFKAAHYFSHKDRLEAVDERKKNLALMKFISDHGFSTHDLNAYLATGLISRKESADNMLVESPNRDGPIPPPTLDPPNLGVGTPAVPAASVPGPSSLRSWSSVVAQSASKAKVALSFCPPDPPVGESFVVRPPREVLLQGNNLWNTSLVGGFLNTRLPFKLVEESAHKMWGKYGLLKVFLQEKGFYLFKFSSSEDRDNVLALGPWYISNKLLLLKYWSEGAHFRSDACTKVPIWVKFHKVPLSYWTPKGLSFLASCIGKPLMLDKQTEKLEPMSYARICIEISTESVLLDKVAVVVFDESTASELQSEVIIEYQSRPQLCPHCKSFGHSLYKCPRANYQWIPKPSAPPPPNSISDTPSSSAGILPLPAGLPPDLGAGVGLSSHSSDDWITVSKKAKLPIPPSPPSLSLPPCTSSLPIPSPAVDPPLDLDSSPCPTPNPLVDKLKIIDEKECKDLRLKGHLAPSHGNKSKKKSRSGGGGVILPQFNLLFGL